jgi:hypothetical protein
LDTTSGAAILTLKGHGDARFAGREQPNPVTGKIRTIWKAGNQEGLVLVPFLHFCLPQIILTALGWIHFGVCERKSAHHHAYIMR